VLSEAGIVAAEPRAQRRVYRLRPERFIEMESWLNTFRPTWEARLDTLEEYLRGLPGGGRKPARVRKR
jgi:hypothetical protein